MNQSLFCIDRVSSKIKSVWVWFMLCWRKTESDKMELSMKVFQQGFVFSLIEAFHRSTHQANRWITYRIDSERWRKSLQTVSQAKRDWRTATSNRQESGETLDLRFTRRRSHVAAQHVEIMQSSLSCFTGFIGLNVIL